MDYNICGRCGAYELGWGDEDEFVCVPCFKEEGQVYDLMRTEHVY